jgi:hypothetical protein
VGVLGEVAECASKTGGYQIGGVAEEDGSAVRGGRIAPGALGRMLVWERSERSGLMLKVYKTGQVEVKMKGVL